MASWDHKTRERARTLLRRWQRVYGLRRWRILLIFKECHAADGRYADVCVIPSLMHATVRLYARSRSDLEATIVHELAHVALDRATFRGMTPAQEERLVRAVERVYGVAKRGSIYSSRR